MPKVEVRGNDLRHAIIKFKRTCEKGSKKRPREDAYETKPTAKRKKQRDAARKRWLKKVFKEQSDLVSAVKASRNRKRMLPVQDD